MVEQSEVQQCLSGGVEQTVFYVYVIESIKNGKRYTGFTSKTPEERLKEHNQGTTNWTSKNRPFKLIYSEKFNSKNIARKREQYLKSSKGREFINKLIPA